MKSNQNLPFFRSRRFAVGLILALSVALPTAPVTSVAQNLPSLGDVDRDELSPLMERRLGEQIMRDIVRDRVYLDDAPLLDYLNKLGTGLVDIHPDARGEANFDYFFFPIRDRSLNAFALPGGFIGVHSGLILAAQNESELASVLAHEIGHVSQRHIARMLGRQRQDSLISMASMVLAALVVGASPDAASAVMMGGQGMAVQRRLNFSRDAEREADRLGLQILREAGYDASGMVAFFGRMQSATRAYGEGAPAYLRSHPLTTERIADIQARQRSERYRQRADDVDFQFVRARARVLQDTSSPGLREATTVFDGLIRQGAPVEAGGFYGRSLVALKEAKIDAAKEWLAKAQQAVNAQSAVISSLAIDIAVAAKEPEQALQIAQDARRTFPLHRGFALQYAEALLAASRLDDAVTYLRDQTQLYRQDGRLFSLLARAYAAQGKGALQHMALAESYALNGGLMGAIEQLGIARNARDASFHDLSVIDAREREFKARWMQQQKDAQAQ